MSLALRKEDLPHYTYADYARWEGRWELIDGVADAMSPSPSFEHQRIYGDLHVLLKEVLEDCPHCQPIQDFDWKIDESTVVCPDNLVICHEPENQNYLTRAPALIFEILSPSTASKDEGLKYRLYESEGVQYYVLIHPEERVLKIYRLHEGRYVKQADLAHESFAFDLGPCRFSLDFARLWRKKGGAT
jgi:Uma2 family endonuclease